MFANRNPRITGSTITFGNAVLNLFLYTAISDIRIFSRDEKKQYDTRLEHGNNGKPKICTKP